jgi:hypothetical protein
MRPTNENGCSARLGHPRQNLAPALIVGICGRQCCQNMSCRCRDGRAVLLLLHRLEFHGELGEYPATAHDLDALVPDPVPGCGIAQATGLAFAAATASTSRSGSAPRCVGKYSAAPGYSRVSGSISYSAPSRPNLTAPLGRMPSGSSMNSACIFWATARSVPASALTLASVDHLPPRPRRHDGRASRRADGRRGAGPSARPC